jgi:hypothetical protein
MCPAFLRTVLSCRKPEFRLEFPPAPYSALLAMPASPASISGITSRRSAVGKDVMVTGVSRVQLFLPAQPCTAVGILPKIQEEPLSTRGLLNCATVSGILNPREDWRVVFRDRRVTLKSVIRD